MKKTLLIICLWLAGVVAGMQFAKFSLTIGFIQVEMGIAPFYSGLLLSSLGLIGIIFGVTSGVIVSYFSPLKLVTVFLFWAAIASLLQTMVSRPSFILTLRILEGVSQLILVSAAPTALLQCTPKRYQSLVMTLWGTFFGVAFLLMNIAQGLLIQHGGWKTIFYAHAVFSTVIALVLLFFRRSNFLLNLASKSGDSAKKLSFVAHHKAAYKEIGSLFPGLLFACHTLMYLVFLTYIPVRFNQTYPSELIKTKYLLISMPLFSLAGTFLSGIILSRRQKSPLALLQSAFAAMIVFCVLIILNSNDILFLAISSAILMCAGFLQGTIFATIPYLSSDSIIHAYANGTITQMGNIGTTLGAPIFSIFLAWRGWHFAFVFPILCSFLGIVLIMAFRKSIRHLTTAST